MLFFRKSNVFYFLFFFMNPEVLNFGNAANAFMASHSTALPAAAAAATVDEDAQMTTVDPPRPSSKPSDVIVITANSVPPAPVMTSRSTPAMALSAVREMTFEQIRQEQIVRYPEMADRIAACADENALWSVLNSRQTRAFTSEELKEVADRVSAADRNDMRDAILERYKIIDPDTGNEIIGDARNPVHAELLKKKFEASFTETTSSAAKTSMLNDIVRMKIAPGGSEASQLRITAEERSLPADQLQVVTTHKINRQIEIVKGATATLNNIVSAHVDDVHCVRVLASEVEFSARAMKNFPLKRELFIDAQAIYGRDLLSSVTFWNAYPTYVWESTLRLLMSGKKAYRNVSSYDYHQSVHMVFLLLIHTDLCPTHIQLLEREEARCNKMKAEAKAADAAAGVVDERRMEDIQFFETSISKAKAAYANKIILSPFNDYLTRPIELGGPWTELDVDKFWPGEEIVSRRSVEEITNRVKAAQLQANKNFSDLLEGIEAKYRDMSIATADTFVEFMKALWILNHAYTVESIRCYEMGLLLLFSVGIPTEYRRTCVVPVEQVPAGYVFKEVAEKMLGTREFYTTVRKHCVNYARSVMEERGELSKITSNGIRFPDEVLATVNLKDFVDPAHEHTPTYGELYEFYKLVTTDYGDVNNTVLLTDAMERLYDSIYDEEGVLRANFSQIMADIERRNIEVDTMNDAKRRRKQ